MPDPSQQGKTSETKSAKPTLSGARPAARDIVIWDQIGHRESTILPNLDQPDHYSSRRYVLDLPAAAAPPGRFTQW